MRVAVTGGRDYDDAQRVHDVLSQAHHQQGIECIINGGARGADHFSTQWADGHRVPTEIYDADWETHGKAAGPLRNKRMLNEGRPDVLIAFPGGAGTKSCVKLAENLGIKVVKVTKHGLTYQPPIGGG